MKDAYIETTSMPLAAFLQSKGFKVHSINKQNPRKAIFSFEFSKELNETKDSYFIGATIEAQRFWNSIKNLKEALYDGV